jgi:hypothetical protein
MPKAKHKYFEIDQCVVEAYWINNGEVVYVCRSKQLGITVGMVLGKPSFDKKGKGSYFYVQMSYVNSWARRHGVRTLINKKLFEEYKAIVTGSGTQDGMKFMKASGYKRDDIFGLILRKSNDCTTRTRS